jgi:hypothetical protein
MNWEILIHYSFLGILVVILAIFIHKNKKKTSVEKVFWYLFYMVMYRTKKGLKLMDNLAKQHKKFFNVMAKIGVVVGFLGMAFVSFILIQSFVKLFIAPPAQPSFALVMPFPAKGIVFVPPIFWIISIVILALFHEGSHGIIARKNKIKLDSTGFAVACFGVPLLPAAFVEPDEKSLNRKKKGKQIEMFAAGPFANVVLFLLFLGLFIGAHNVFLGDSNAYYNPLENQILEQEGVQFIDYYMKDNSPVFINDVPLNTTFTHINGKPILDEERDNFAAFLSNAKPGDIISLRAKNGTEYAFPLAVHPESTEENPRPLLGAQITYSTKPFSYEGSFAFVKLFLLKMLLGLLAWLYILNLGVGLFNLLPMGPLDGGRMLKALFEKIFKRKKDAVFYWKLVSYIFLLILLIVILYPFFV